MINDMIADYLGVTDPLPDGTPLADLQAAMQAAWLADNRSMSAELAKRHGLLDKLCLRCALPSISLTAYVGGPETTYSHLCQPCVHEVLRPHAKPVTGLDPRTEMMLYGRKR
jgi:hypothetical protein